MRDRVTFVHTADLHLDAPFAGVAASDARIGSELAEATFTAFERVVDTCLAREADFLVIAGDAYNSAERSLRAQLRFKAQVERLAERGIEVFIVHGNHDPANGWSARLPLPESVHVFPTDSVARYEVVRDGEIVAAVYGRSFGTAAVRDNLALGYRRAGDEPLAIGVLHANVGGDADYDNYAPATLQDLSASGMDYWALGHIHKQSVLSRSPWVVYCGSPQGLNPKEIGAHGCMVVTAERGEIVSVEPVETAPVVWARETVDISQIDDLDGARRALESACERLRDGAGRPLVARVELTGRSGAHADIARAGNLTGLADDLRAEQAARTPWLWLDRLEDSSAAQIDLDAVRYGADFASELLRIADELAADPQQLSAEVDAITSPVAATLSGLDLDADASELLERARDLALDRLLTQGGDAL